MTNSKKHTIQKGMYTNQRAKRALKRAASGVSLKQLKKAVDDKRSDIITDVICDINEWIVAEDMDSQIFSYNKNKFSQKTIEFHISGEWYVLFNLSKHQSFREAQLMKKETYFRSCCYVWKIEYDYINSCIKSLTGSETPYYNHEPYQYELVAMCRWVENFIGKELIEESITTHGTEWKESQFRKIYKHFRTQLKAAKREKPTPIDDNMTTISFRTISVFQTILESAKISIGNQDWIMTPIINEEENSSDE